MLVSHGRGGAGNIARSTKFDSVTPKDLQTPTLKSSVVTTGRGGSGNMAPNNDPYETRLRQDCEAGPRRTSSGAAHVGRGGAANIVRDAVASGEVPQGKTSFDSVVVDDEDSSSHHAPATRRRSSEIAVRGKAWLQNLAGKKA